MKRNRCGIRLLSLAALCWLTSLVSIANAQGPSRRCSTEDPNSAQFAVAHAHVNAMKGAMTAGDQPIQIQIAFHVIQDSAGSNTASLELLTRQIDRLNASFSGAFIFSLGSVETIVNDRWFLSQIRSEAFNQMVSSLRVGDAGTLNVYVLDPYRVRPGDAVGYSSFPWNYVTNPELDGVSVFFGALPGGTSARFNEGKTLVHETGHWLGLLHTFQRPNPSKPLSARNNGCVGRGDFISDTPAEQKPHYSCTRRIDSCPAKGVDPLDNYMSYARDSCLTRFTPKQVRRMREIWREYRAQG